MGNGAYERTERWGMLKMYLSDGLESLKRDTIEFCKHMGKGTSLMVAFDFVECG